MLQSQMKDELGAREYEAVKLVWKGFTDDEIAEIMGVKKTTVRTQIMYAERKLGVENKLQLAALRIAELEQTVNKLTDRLGLVM